MTMQAGPLDGRVALVTGAARGLGRAEAARLRADGATVILADVRDELGQAAANALGPGAEYQHLDVSERAEWRAVVDGIINAHGRLDILVNNAGICQPATLADTTDELMARHIAVNQRGVFLGLQAAAAPMTRAGRGVIVNISSIVGMKGFPGLFAYSSTKWAIRGMTKAAAAELGPHGIRVVCVEPGVIDTDISNTAPESRRKSLEATALGRPAQPDEVAAVVAMLVSDAGSYMTASDVLVDGGLIG
jgi:3alpha(or 20beta)-hydroxysteroid dehydrogenase